MDSTKKGKLNFIKVLNMNFLCLPASNVALKNKGRVSESRTPSAEMFVGVLLFLFFPLRSLCTMNICESVSF